MIQRLAGIDPVFRDWKEKVNTSPEDAPAVPTSQDSLAEYIASCEDPVFAKLGYSMAMWSGSPDGEGTSWSVSCGASRTAKNNLSYSLLSLPVQPDDVQLDADAYRETLEASVEAWEPDWGSVVTFELQEALDEALDLEAHEPLVGWMFYLDASRSPLPELPEVHEVHRHTEGGHLVVVDEQPLWATNDEDVERLVELQSRLREAGVMRPIQKK